MHYSLWPWSPQDWAGEERGKTSTDAGSFYRLTGQDLTLLLQVHMANQSWQPINRCIVCTSVFSVGLGWLEFILFIFLWFDHWIRLGLLFTLVKQLKMWLWIQNRHHTDSGRGCYLSSASRNNVHHLLHAFNSHIYNFRLMLNYRSHTKTLSSSGKHPLRSYGLSCYKCKCWIKTTVQLFDLLNNLNILTSVMRLFFFIFLGRFSLEI